MSRIKKNGNLISFETIGDGSVEKACVTLPFKRYGSGIPSPSNVMSMRVYNTIDAVFTKKNLYDKNKNTINYCIDSNGDLIDAVNWWSVSDYIPVPSGNSITYQGLTTVGTAPMAAWYNEDKTLISTFKHHTGVNTMSVPSNAKYVRFSIYKHDDAYNGDTFMVEVGATASTYEGYSENKTTTQFGVNVYKGSIDLINGVLTANYIEFPVSKIAYGQSSSTYDQLQLFTDISSDVDAVLSDQYAVQNASGTVGRLSWYSNRVYFNIPTGQLITKDDDGASAWLEQYHPQFVIMLKTPYVYQLTPKQMQSFVGINNVYANIGNIDVEIKENGVYDLSLIRARAIAMSHQVE